MSKRRLSVLICGALLSAIPSLVFAGKPGGASDINVGTIYFADGTMQSTATLQGPQGPTGLMGPVGPAGSLGAAGINGYNSLILITDELPGCNCANGGTKFQVGLDQNRSGTLDIVEVLQTKYMCNGATSVTPTLAPITVTASATTQIVNSFVDITATIKNADGTAASYGSINFGSSGSCMLYNSYNNSYSNFASDYLTPGGIVSVALTNTSSGGGPCIVYADYYNPSTLVSVTGSAVVTFVQQQ